jgi:hypothetical protein
MEAATPPLIETLHSPRRHGWSRRAVRRAAWVALDLLAVGACGWYAVQSLT